MSSNLIFKQLSERHTGVEITNLCWNSKYDLLALSNSRGEIILQRLFWKKAWEYSCPFENVNVSAMCWSPNGECLFVAYSNFVGHFLELENGKLIHELKHFPAETLIIKWFEVPKNSTDSNFVPVFKDLIADFPSLEKVSGSKTDRNGSVSFTSTFLKEGFSTNLLILGHSNGNLSIYLNGYLHLTTIFFGFSEISMLDFDFFDNFQTCFVSFFDSHREKIHIKILNSNYFVKQLDEFHRFGLRIGKLISSYQYLDAVLKRILDSWEDLLIEVGDKFHKFAREKSLRDPSSTVGDELLVVSCFGSASSEFQTFLSQDLTEKHLKKLIQTLENNYQNLKRLLFLNLNSALSSIFYNLIHVREFDTIIDENFRLSAQKKCASASLKSREVFTVADQNFARLASFFDWLQKVLLSITEENVPPSSTRQTSSNINFEFVTKFVEENFVKTYKDDETPLFQLEKVGQYLKNENLSSPFEYSSSILDDLTVCELNKNSSLLQEILRLKQSLDEFLVRIPEKMNEILFTSDVPTIEFDGNTQNRPVHLRVTRKDNEFFRIFVSEGSPAKGFRASDVDEKGQILRSFDFDGPYSVLDLNFYSSKLTTFLVEKHLDIGKSYNILQLDDACFSLDQVGERKAIRLDYSMSVYFIFRFLHFLIVKSKFIYWFF